MYNGKSHPDKAMYHLYNQHAKAKEELSQTYTHVCTDTIASRDTHSPAKDTSASYENLVRGCIAAARNIYKRK